MKIYVMGSTGVGKTTFSKKLSKKLNINYYELDKIVYDNEKHRLDEEIEKSFKKIINKNSWIIEDIGRKRFIEGREACDKIYYLKCNSIVIYKQMINRWLKQRYKNEDYNIKPTIKNLFRSLKDVYLYKKQEKEIIASLEPFKDKVNFLNKRDISDICN